MSLPDAAPTAARLSGHQTSVDEPPTITAIVEPLPNDAGWHSSDVIVLFQCFDDLGIAECSGPAKLTVEGTGQVVTGTVTDTGGQVRSVSVTVNIDKTKPTVSITAPADGASTAGVSVAASATVQDDRSGVSLGHCNSAPAVISGSDLDCSMSLMKGHNVLRIEVEDLAGNRGAAAVGVARTGATTAVSVQPEQATVLIGGEQPLRLVDDFGQEQSSVVWTVLDDTVAEVVLDDDDRYVAKGLTAGTTTITGTVGSHSASMTVTVAAGTVWVDGAPRWQASAFPGFETRAVVRGIANEDGAELFAVETQPSGDAPIVVRGLRRDGSQASVSSIPLQGWEFSAVHGSAQGGVLLRTFDRIIQVGGQSTWQQTGYGILAQAADGTVYTVGDGGFVALDGMTGQRKWAVTLPNASSREVNIDCESWRPSQEIEGFGQVHQVVVAEDGTIWAMVQHSRHFFDFLPCGTGYVENEVTFQVLKVSPTGSAEWLPIYHDEYSGPASPGQPMGEVTPGRILPLGGGKVLVTWTLKHRVNGQFVTEAHVAEFGGSSLMTATTASSLVAFTNGTWSGDLVLSEGGQAYGHIESVSGTQLVALNSSSGALLWQQPSLGELVAGAAGGGVVVGDGSTTTTLDASGAVVGTAPVAGAPAWASLWVTHDWTGMRAAVGPIVDVANVGWAFPAGSQQGQNADRPIMVVNNTGQSMIVKLEECSLGFESIEAGGYRRHGVDGVKQPSRTPHWYKVLSGIRVDVPAIGRPTKSGISPWRLVPDCDYDETICLAGYGRSGGYKKEPDWSDEHWDWKYPGPPPEERKKKC